MKEYNRIQWFFLPKHKKLEYLIDMCIYNGQALNISTPKHHIRLDFKTKKLEVEDK